MICIFPLVPLLFRKHFTSQVLALIAVLRPPRFSVHLSLVSEHQFLLLHCLCSLFVAFSPCSHRSLVEPYLHLVSLPSYRGWVWGFGYKG